MKKLISLIVLMGSIELAHADGNFISFRFYNLTDSQIDMKFNDNASNCVYQKPDGQNGLPDSVSISPKNGMVGPYVAQTSTAFFKGCPLVASTFAFDFFINGQKQTCGLQQGKFHTNGTPGFNDDQYHSTCSDILGNSVYVSAGGQPPEGNKYYVDMYIGNDQLKQKRAPSSKIKGHENERTAPSHEKKKSREK